MENPRDRILDTNKPQRVVRRAPRKFRIQTKFIRSKVTTHLRNAVRGRTQA